MTAQVTDGVTDGDEWQAAFDERAGFLEFDCHLTRAEAERQALNETVAALGPRPLGPGCDGNVGFEERAHGR